MLLILTIYSLLAAALWYLGSRAIVTSWLWQRYPARFASFMDCAACTGFWWGVIISTYAALRDDGLSIDISINNPIVVGLCLIVLTPLSAAILTRALFEVGAIIEPTNGPNDSDGF